VFRGKDSLHFQSQRINQTGNLQEASKRLLDYTASHPKKDNILHSDRRENPQIPHQGHILFRLSIVKCGLLCRILTFRRDVLPPSSRSKKVYLLKMNVVLLFRNVIILYQTTRYDISDGRNFLVTSVRERLLLFCVWISCLSVHVLICGSAL
jgi:hypothetical protein